MNNDEELAKQVESLFDKINKDLGDPMNQKIIGSIWAAKKPLTFAEIREFVQGPAKSRIDDLCKLGYIKKTDEGYILTEYMKYLISLVKKYENFRDMLVHMYV